MHSAEFKQCIVVTAGVTCKDYLSLIMCGETALLGIHSNIPVGLEIKQKKGKRFMVHVANISKYLVYTCLINPSCFKTHSCCPCISKLVRALV